MPTNKIFLAKYNRLNPKQKEAVEAIYGPVMVVAGPGTGKTTVLTLRIANILAKTDAKPEEILALTFTDSGAKHMREALREIIGDASFRVNIFTFHSFANHMRALYPENFKKIGERMQCDMAGVFKVLEDILSHQSFEELRISQYGVNIGKIAKRISDLKRELITPKDLEKLIAKEEKSLDEKEKEKQSKYLIRIKEFARLYALYEAELEKRALYDFDDAILGFIDALKSNPDMAAEMRESFQFVLADEHQDANGAQNEILRMFEAKGLDAPNMFVVGDDKQSIFRFQGASLEHFYNFGSVFKGAKKISLTENYRSHKIIIDASHSLISNDKNKHQKLSPNVSYDVKKIDVVEYPKYEAELAGTAKKVKDILAKSSKESVAIIARNNKALFDIAPYLEAEKVEFNIAGERSIFDDFHYKKLLYLFGALVDPYDGRLLKALYAGYFKADISDIIALASLAKKQRVDFAMLYLQSDISGIKELVAKAKKMQVLEFLREIKKEISQGQTSFEYDVLRAIFSEASELTKRNRGATLDDLVAHLKFLEKHNLAPLNVEDTTKNRVELRSIHKAKGLEYDHVFIIDATAKRFEGSGGRADSLRIPGVGTDTELSLPASDLADRRWQAGEERRLLYVALTRAKRHASVSYSLSGDDGADSHPSILLSEIDDAFLERQTAGHISAPDLLSVAIAKPDKKLFKDTFLSRTFSVSALNNFILCPWKYFFRNLLLVPEPSEFAASLGNACHDALRIFHTNAKKGNILNKDELIKLVEQCVYKEPFTQAELPIALKKAKESVLAYAQSFVPFDPKEKVFVEEMQSFVYKVNDKKSIFEITITGKIDLSREKDGEASVIDFKTKKRMTKNAIQGLTKGSDGDEMRQLQFYKFLLERVREDINVSSGTLTFLSPEKGRALSETFALTDTDKLAIEEALLKALLSIYNLDFWGTTCGEKNCEYCTLSKLIA